MMKNYLAFVLICLFCTTLKAQEVYNAIDSLLIEYKISLSKNEIERDSTYVNFLQAVKMQEGAERKFNGKFGFGLNVSSSRNLDISKFNVSAKLSRGFFPSEFSFSTALQVEVQNGNFIENVSDLSISYDHHIKNSLDFESFSFLKRSTNSFLNIDQRYEVGSGIIWNVWYSGKEVVKATKNSETYSNKRRKYLTENGVKKLSSLRDFEPIDKETNEAIALDLSENDKFFALCSEEYCPRPNETMSKAQKKAFKKALNRVLRSVSKQESKYRLSLLMGINYESERTSDSLRLFYTDSILRKRSFAPVSLLRGVIGPKLEYKHDRFEAETRAYFKVGIGNDNFNNEVTSGNLVDERIDYRVEWLSTVSYNFTKKIGLKASFNYVYINAPRRRYFSLDNTLSSSTELFIAANRFSNLVFTFTYEL